MAPRATVRPFLGQGGEEREERCATSETVVQDDPRMHRIWVLSSILSLLEDQGGHVVGFAILKIVAREDYRKVIFE